MTRIVSLLSLVLFTAFNGYAQPAALVNAKTYFDDKDFEKAKASIDMASSNEQTSSKEKTWKMKGDIYLAYYTEMEGGIKTQEKLDEILSYYKKAIELDKKYGYEKEIDKNWSLSQNMYLNEGVSLFNQKKYDEAYKVFLMTISIAEFRGETDTLAMYNAGLAAERGGKISNAIKWYDRCESVGYKGPGCCAFSIYLHRSIGEEEEMKKRLAECRTKYPNDQNLLTTEINQHLKEGKLAQVVPLLELSISYDPNNKHLHYALGTAHDGLKNFEKAESSYGKAVSIDPNFFDAWYNLGALYFNTGVDLNNALTENSDPDVYLAKKKELDEVFKNALSYLEKAHSIKPNDLNTLESLKQLYARMDNGTKYAEVDEKIKSIKGN